MEPIHSGPTNPFLALAMCGKGAIIHFGKEGRERGFVYILATRKGGIQNRNNALSLLLQVLVLLSLDVLSNNFRPPHPLFLTKRIDARCCGLTKVRSLNSEVGRAANFCRYVTHRMKEASLSLSRSPKRPWLLLSLLLFIISPFEGGETEGEGRKEDGAEWESTVQRRRRRRGVIYSSRSLFLSLSV